MTSIEKTAPDTIRLERRFPVARETLWRWLTDAELRRQWFMAGPIDGRAGGSIGFTVAHENLSSEPVETPERYAKMKGVSFAETITEWDPPRRLGYSWDGGKEGEVSFELEPDGADATRLVLTHRGISGPAPMANFGGGWHSHLAVLEAKLSGGSVRDFWALHRASEAAVAAQIGA